MMADVIAFVLVFIGVFFYKLFKTENVRKAMIYALTLTAGAVFLVWLNISGLFLVLGLICLIFGGDRKRPGYPYSARAGQLRAWHTIHRFKSWHK